MTTTKAATKRAERERRRANGEVRVECWISAEDATWLRGVFPAVSEGIGEAVWYYRNKHSS